MPTGAGASTVRSCAFCGSAETNVTRLFEGRGCLICDECVDLCNDIIREELAWDDQSADRPAGRSNAEVFCCSCCGAENTTVDKLIAGPRRLFICDLCVGRFVEQLPADRPRRRGLPLTFRAIELVLKLVLMPLWWLRWVVTHGLRRAR